MRILYCAIDQRVPGTIGGAVHVAAVARGLARLGHDVHVLTGRGAGPFPDEGVHWHDLAAPMGAPHLRLLRARTIRQFAKDLQPNVVIERYHNFGGEGLLAARAVHALSVLEVNAPVVDYPGSAKRTLDRLLVAEPMRRWRDWQCGVADLIVTPSPVTVPTWVEPRRIVEIEWGADTDAFRPEARRANLLAREPGDTLAVFAGAFRAWHGAIHLVEAIARLRNEGRRDIKAVLIGDGPELPGVRQAAQATTGVEILGAVPHHEMPALLASADIGAAPFDLAAHAPLSLGFYWSPLKIFEYMASGLPVVAPAIDRLSQLVRHGHEGLLYEGPPAAGLAAALAALTDPERRRTLGSAARERAVAEFGWDAHCRRLETAIRDAQERPSAAPAVLPTLSR